MDPSQPIQCRTPSFGVGAVNEPRTSRLLLRPFRVEDVPAVHAYAGDPDVVRYVDWGPNTLDETEAFVSAAVNPIDGVHPFAVEHADALIGAVELRVTAAAHRRGEFGYAVSGRRVPSPRVAVSGTSCRS